MSECVVRMEMPKNCYECEMRGERGFCPIGKLCVVGYRKQRHEDCPIICQLPEGHGRLVEESEAIRLIDKWFDAISLNPDILIDSIKSLPTIVPAERSEK